MRGIRCSRRGITKRLHIAIILIAALSLVTYADAASHAASSTMMTKITRVAQNPCNPCAAKARMNPCNPCAAKNPCNPCNPCGAAAKVNPKLVMRPTGTGLYRAPETELIAAGKKLWKDRMLGTSGLACSTCHVNFASLKPSFLKPYPHHVEMPNQRAGLQKVTLDEMVQFCMVVPMAAKPLGWDSRELAALTAYAKQVQKAFVKAAAANPCMLKQTAANPCNPCAAKNPCNPCAAKARMNPCNPCAAKNPCGKRN